MKKLIYIFVIALLASCASTPKKVTIPAVKDKAGNLVGVATKAHFQQEPYGSDWFNDFYEYYEVDTNNVEKLKSLLKGVEIKAFMGTWCGDSKREIPNFYKTLDKADFNYKNLELVAVDRAKKAKGLEQGYDIKRVPTFIFYKKGKEIGRFVEHAVGSGATLEGDFVKILSNSGYKHAYSK